MATESDTPNRPSAEDDCRVVVFDTADDPHRFRDLLVERLSMHPTDAMILVHATPGILPERLRRDEAENLAAAIQELNITAEVISHDDIPDFVHSKQVHNIRLLDEGLALLSVGGQQEMVVPWNEVEMLSVGQIPGDFTRHYFFDNDVVMTAARRRYIAPDELDGASTMVLWVLCEHCRKGFRLEKSHMNFSELGSRMTMSAATNFHLFVEEIAARAPRAILTPATRSYLGHGAMRHVQFSSEEDLKRYTTFHLLLQERLRKRASQ